MTFFDQTAGTNSYLEKRFGIKIREMIVRKLLGDVHNSAVLDIGCGDGTISLQFANSTNHLTFIDLSSNVLDIARKNTPVQFVNQYSYLNKSFLDLSSENKFDIILFIGVIAHVPSLDKAITKISELLNENGSCIIQFSESNHIFTKISNLKIKILDFLGINRYQYKLTKTSINEIQSCLQSKNLRIREIINYSIMLPLMGRLPDSFLFVIQKTIINSRWLSRFGSDRMLLVTKSEHS